MWHPRSAFVLLLLLLEMGWVTLATDTTTSAQSTGVSSSTANASYITTTGLITSFSTQSNNSTNTASNNVTMTQSNNSLSITPSSTNTASNNATQSNNSLSITPSSTNTASNNATQSNNSVSITTSSTNTASNNATQSNNSVSITTSSTNTASNNATATQSNSSLSTPTSSTATASPITQTNSTSQATPTVTSALITPIPSVILNLGFKITGRNFSQNLSDPNSEEYKGLKNNLENSLADIYKKKFTNFRSVNITQFSNGSIIVVSEVSFTSSQSPVAPTADNAVRVLASSIQQNGSIGDFQVDASTIKSGSVNTSSLSPLVVTVNFLIKRPYSNSLLESLKNQTISWVEGVLLNFLNATTLTTRAADPNITFSNNNSWVQTNAQFSFNTLSVLDQTTDVISKLLDARVNVSFSIVPSTLTVQGISQTFILFQPPLAIMNVTQTADLSNKTSDTFQNLSKGIEDSLKAIFSSQQLVEPVVNSFSMLNDLVIAFVDLYFPSSSTMNRSTVINEIVTNKTEFSNRNISLDSSFTLQPRVAYTLQFMLIQNYTTDVSNLNSTIQSLLTENLIQIFNDSIKPNPTIIFSNNSGSTNVTTVYQISAANNPDNNTVVLDRLLHNTTFTNLVRIYTLSVNGTTPEVQMYKFRPRFTNKNFTDDLTNRSSDGFKNLKNNITQALNIILQNMTIQQIVVASFEPGSIISNIEVTVKKVGNSSEQVAATIVNSSSVLQDFGLSLDPVSLVPTATTVAPVTSSVTTSPASTSTNGTSTNTTSTPISTTASTPSGNIALNVTFRITNQEFTNNLNNSNSTEYKDLKGKVENQLNAVYSTFKNFKYVNVTGFRKGSVIVDSNVTFDSNVQSSTDVTNDNLVRALASSIQSNGSLGDLNVDPNSIQSGSSNVANLSPVNITVGFLIKIPYNASATDSLQNQITPWVNSSFLTLPNVTSVSLISNNVSNSNNWTQFNATYAVVTTYLFNATQALDKVLNFRGNVPFYIVPSTLSIQGSSKSFNTLSPTLGIQNVGYTQSLSDKTSDAFKNNATAIEGVLRAIFQNQQLVEPVVTSFRNDSRGLLVSVDLYFLSGITSWDVIQGIVNNIAQFSQKNITLITKITDPTVPYSLTFNLLQDYTADLTTNNITNILDLIASALTSNSSNILFSSASIRNNSGAATVGVQYRVNDTLVNNTAVQNTLVHNSNFTDIVRISTLSVNGASNNLQGYAYKLRFTNLIFNANLTNPSSDDYKNMKIKIIRAMTSILSLTGAQQVGVLSFVSGSVIANTEITVPNGGLTFDQVTTAIVNNMDSLKSFGLTLDPQSVVSSTPSGAASTVQPPPTISAFPGYAVAIIVMCGLAILALPFLILFFVKTGLCSKVSKACSLKPPNGRYQGMLIPNKGAGLDNYRTHSYEISH